MAKHLPVTVAMILQYSLASLRSRQRDIAWFWASACDVPPLRQSHRRVHMNTL
jgi:hypothetical protein